MSEADERKSGTVTPKLDRENQAFVVADELGIILDVNDRFEQLFGWKHEQIVGMPLTTIIPPRLRQAHHLGFSRFVTTGASNILGRPLRLAALRRNGEEFDAEHLIVAHQDGEAWTFEATVRPVGGAADGPDHG